MGLLPTLGTVLAIVLSGTEKATQERINPRTNDLAFMNTPTQWRKRDNGAKDRAKN
jgi:hypothetical protein